MTTINVNYAAMAQAVESIQRWHGALTSTHEDLDTFLNNLRGGWQGDAADSWKVLHANWNDSVGAAHQLLAYLGNALDTGLGNYYLTNTNIAQWFGG